MSRSTRKPYITDQNNGKPNRTRIAKKNANKKARNAEDIANGKAYRKVGSIYDIRDWSIHSPKNPKAYRK